MPVYRVPKDDLRQAVRNIEAGNHQIVPPFTDDGSHWIIYAEPRPDRQMVTRPHSGTLYGLTDPLEGRPS